MHLVSDRRDDVRDARLCLLEQIGNGILKPGDDLPITNFARDRGWSATTVREAVRLLVGEGVVTERAARGFWIPIRHPGELRGLYHASAVLSVALAERLDRLDRRLQVTDYPDLPFSALRLATGEPALLLALRPVDAALLPLRRVERAFCETWQDEETAMTDAVAMGDRPRLRRLLELWHTRWSEMAGPIAEAASGSVKIDFR